MGQKKRSTAPRQVPATSNGFLPASPAAGLKETTGSFVHSADAELSEASKGSSLYVDNKNGGPMANGTVEACRNGFLEPSKTFQGDLSIVKSDCEKALVALRRGNSNKALRIIRDACNRYENNALAQRIHGHICMRLATLIEDQTTKQRHLKEAIEAAQKAVRLSPYSIEYAHFHAQLLFDAASDSKGYEEVVQECQRALEIVDPIDPAKESLHDEGQQKFPTAEARIAQLQQELRSLVQKANIASISNWMKALGTGGRDDKLQLIHMRKGVDDPMEQRISQPKRPHEVKKSVKTPEEKRKDIEVRVAAARLLQQRRDYSPPQHDDAFIKPGRSGSRLERRKSGGMSSRKANQSQSIEDKIDRLKPFWNSIGPTDREKMLEVPLQSLKQQFNSVKNSLTAELVTEALQFAQEKKTWRFWTCCSCGERFTDCQEHAEHVLDKHIDNLSPKLRRVIPTEIDQDMAKQILAENSRPIDGPAAMKLLVHSHCLDIDVEAAEHQVVNSIALDCFGEENASSTNTCFDSLHVDSFERKSPETYSSMENIDSNVNGKLEVLSSDKYQTCNGKCQKPKSTIQIANDMKHFEFPLVDDEERTKLLQKIYNFLHSLIRNKCLASDHMHKILQYALDELQNFIQGVSVHYEFIHSPVYIKFLSAPQLRRIFGFLKELVNACNLDTLSAEGVISVTTQNENNDIISDELLLNGGCTALILDERLLKDPSVRPFDVPSNNEIECSGNLESVSNDTNGYPKTVLKDENSVSHADLQLSWIYGTADYEQQPVSWKQYREARAQHSRDILRALEKEFQSLQNLCERKHEHLQYEAAVNAAETLCVKELEKRELKMDISSSSHEAVLRKRKQELHGGRASGLSSQQKLELEVITSILRDAQTVNLPQFPYDGAISVTSSRLSDSDEDDEDGWRVPELVSQLDNCIEVAIQRKKERCTSEINKLDARILRSMDVIQKLEHKLGNSSILDYRSFVLPLVKSFLKVHLEGAAEKDALEKSDAAQKAFLAELSRDEKNAADKLQDSGRNSKEKSKEKKKGKEQKRSKDGKRSSLPVSLQGTQEGAKMNGLITASVSESPDDEEVLEWETEESRHELEAELRRQAEVEDEERKLAETLELQRRIEEESKERHLAELKRKQNEQELKLGTKALDVPVDNGVLHADVDVVTSSLKEAVVIGSSLPENVVHLSNGCNVSKREQANGLNVSVPHENLQKGSSISSTAESMDFGNQDQCMSKSKRSGKNRKKKVNRTSQEHLLKEENSDNGGSVSETSRHPTENGFTVHSCSTGGSNTCKKKQNGESDKSGSEYSVKNTSTSSRTLQQLKDEQDAEERFQADLEQAMRQSLDFTPTLSEIEPSRSDDLRTAVDNKRIEEVGKGLQNGVGQYNCFLNVVIQSLWHLRRFREELLDSSSVHNVHMGDPCVVCALRDIFVGLNSPISDTTKEAVAPTALRIALSNLFAQKDFFQEAQMNDASEVLAVVFECLHKAFSTNLLSSNGQSNNSNGIGFWECQDNSFCIAHNLFSLDISMQMNCTNCGLESRQFKYTTFFHNINANSLRTAKIMYQERSLDKLLRLVEMNHLLACDTENGGCGQQNYLHYLLRAAPHVFIIVLGWQKSRESFEDISATIDAIAADVDLGVVYCGIDSGFRHRLVSVICYYGQHYHCFAFNHEIGRWVMFDDTTVKVIGTYDDVMETCRRGHLQPQVLFYETSPR